MNDTFYLLGGVIYKKNKDGADTKLCIVFRDLEKQNETLLLNALNSYGKVNEKC